ncbi:tetratricopeptide repeat-containing sensor histidine kinase [Moheibacter stercoris]|uniref:histidine kinase n=1 Tax=Moheibacter stercoris TaxID=1628251 RepID=A0ABV2LQL7_9FLAO
MKHYFTILLFLLLNSVVFSQNNLEDVTDPEILELVKKANECSQNRLDNCDKIYQEAINLGEKKKEPYVQYLYYVLARHKMQNGEQDDAMKIYDDQFPLIKDEMLKISFMNLRGNYFSLKNQKDEAIEMFLDIAKILENRKDYDKLIVNYFNTATQFSSIYNFEKHLEYLFKAYEALQKSSDKTLEVSLVAAIAEGYMSLKDFEESKNWAEKAISIPTDEKDIQNKKGRSKAYSMLAEYYARNNEFEKAIDYSDKSVQEIAFLKSDSSIADALFKKALIFYRKEDYKSSKDEMSKALEMFRTLNLTPKITQTLLFLGLACDKTGDYKEATTHLLEHIRLKDNSRLDQNIVIVNELTAKYENEKKEKQIAEQELEIQKKNNQRNIFIGTSVGLGLLALLIFGGFYQNKKINQQRITTLKAEQEAALLKSLMLGEEKERKRLAQELHDGIASNLVAVKLQIENNSDSDKLLNLVRDTHREIRQVAHNLMPIDFEKENIVKVVKTFCDDCSTEKQPIIFQSNVEQVNLNKDHAMVLYRVVQEFIQNAIKHSNAKQIDVMLMKNEDVLTVNIEDDGVGFNLEAEKKSKGLSGIIERFEKINGQINIDSSQRGTSVFLLLKTV